MYTAKHGTNVVWNLVLYKILEIPVIGQLHCNNSAVVTTEIK